ncbi:hypothetical protein F8388_004526 [Cannabis sativa]|uniref:Uncharacterized protein n=1 Tax=Cannabis sativa TaxID=3483 RepID=A0A7J6EQN9_CANSA|nr:hypothetical protein F8388_004526 [Cannabis sativa]
MSRGPERQWFTLWRMSSVRVRLSPTRELSRYKAISTLGDGIALKLKVRFKQRKAYVGYQGTQRRGRA